jgi:hypothetical protein
VTLPRGTVEPGLECRRGHPRFGRAGVAKCTVALRFGGDSSATPRQPPIATATHDGPQRRRPYRRDARNSQAIREPEGRLRTHAQRQYKEPTSRRSDCSDAPGYDDDRQSGVTAGFSVSGSAPASRVAPLRSSSSGTPIDVSSHSCFHVGARIFEAVGRPTATVRIGGVRPRRLR